MNTLDIVYEYKNILENIETIINKSPYKKEYLIEKLGISRVTYYNKLRNKTFTIDEVKTLSELILPEQKTERENRIFNDLIAKSEKDYLEGKVIDYELSKQKAIRLINDFN